MASDIVNKSVSWAGKTRYNIVLFNLLAQGQIRINTQHKKTTTTNTLINCRKKPPKSLESNQYSWNFN